MTGPTLWTMAWRFGLAFGLPLGLPLERRVVARYVVSGEVGGVRLEHGEQVVGLFLEGGVTPPPRLPGRSKTRQSPLGATSQSYRL